MGVPGDMGKVQVWDPRLFWEQIRCAPWPLLTAALDSSNSSTRFPPPFSSRCLLRIQRDWLSWFCKFRRLKPQLRSLNLTLRSSPWGSQSRCPRQVPGIGLGPLTPAQQVRTGR